MEYGKGRLNKAASGNEDVEETDTRKEEELAGTSTKDAIRNSSQTMFILLTNRKG
jgi:hypothetical protein